MSTASVQPVLSKILVGLTILIVEDSKIIRGVYETYLTELGCHLAFAEHGWDALEYLRGGDPHLILLDMDMPQMDGATFLRYFSCSSSFRRVPVVIVSSRTKEEEIGEKVLRLSRGYIQKPFGPLVLRHTVQTTVRRV